MQAAADSEYSTRHVQIPRIVKLLSAVPRILLVSWSSTLVHDSLGSSSQTGEAVQGVSSRFEEARKLPVSGDLPRY